MHVWANHPAGCGTKKCKRAGDRKQLYYKSWPKQFYYHKLDILFNYMYRSFTNTLKMEDLANLAEEIQCLEFICSYSKSTVDTTLIIFDISD